MYSLYKSLFMMTLMAGTLISISSNSWLGVWMGLEMNLLSIIPLMNDSKSPQSTESSLKYFITQAMASVILLVGVLIDLNKSNLMMNMLTLELPSLSISTALAIKMGAAPMHFWFPEVMEGLSWFNAMLMLTWQKIAPMSLFSYNNMTEMFSMFLILTSTITGGVMGLNQTSMRKILTYSSITHIGWMLAAMMLNEMVWKWYITIYMTMNITIIWLMIKLKISSLAQLMTVSKMSPQLKIFLMFNFFSLGGVPPFIGFLPKWLTIQSLVQNKMYLTSLIMILTTLITLYFYMRITMPPLSMETSNLPLNISNKTISEKKIMMMNSILFMSLAVSTMTFYWT